MHIEKSETIGKKTLTGTTINPHYTCVYKQNVDVTQEKYAKSFFYLKSP